VNFTGGNKMGRSRMEIDETQLEALCRMNPTLKDTSAFFKCSEDTIERDASSLEGL
jgi:hypothetical protein